MIQNHSSIKQLSPKQFQNAGFSRRLLAHNIDLIPLLLVLYGFSFVVPRSSYDPLYIAIIYLAYNIISEVFWQATIGKKWTKLVVVDNRGKKATAMKSVVRNVSKIASLLLLFGGFIMINFTREKQGLHDLIGGTLVLFNEE